MALGKFDALDLTLILSIGFGEDEEVLIGRIFSALGLLVAFSSGIIAPNLFGFSGTVLVARAAKEVPDLELRDTQFRPRNSKTSCKVRGSKNYFKLEVRILSVEE